MYARSVAAAPGSGVAARPSSMSVNGISTETPPGATRDRISLTASTASWSTATDSSSHVPAAIPSRSEAGPDGTVGDPASPACATVLS